MKTVLRETFTALNIYIRREDLNKKSKLPLRKLEKEEQINPKVSRGKEII